MFSRLRFWFGISALLMIVVVAGFYGYARYRVRKALQHLPPLGINIQQNTAGFTYSQSAGGHTIFSITASNAVRYKEGGKAELHQVKIVSYGRDSDRLDQISGDEFEFDEHSGDIVAKGRVQIQLQAAQAGTSGPDKSVKEIGSPVHLEASGLTFNKNTGVARTTDKVTFELPQASGSAVGANYDSKRNTLNLYSDIHLRTTGPKPANLQAGNALFEQDARQLTLTDLHGESGIRHVETHRVVLRLREDNTVEKAEATGGVIARVTGIRSAEIHAANADFNLGPKNNATSGRLGNGVAWETSGPGAARGNAGEALLAFGPNNQIKLVQLRDRVDLVQAASNATTTAGKPSSAQDSEFRGDGLDLKVSDGTHLQNAVSVGSAQIIMAGTQAASKPDSAAAKSKTVITASQFEAKFSSENQLSTLTGYAPVKIVSSTSGQQDRVSESRDLLATFSKGKQTTLQDLTQTGNVQIQEGERKATADRATYNQASDAMTLSGNVRYADLTAGSSLSSNTLTLNRTTGQTSADGDVKTTYSEQKNQSAGAMFSSSQPVHVTAKQMSQNNSTGTMRYSGAARLWQGGSVVQAPQIEFNRANRTLDAQGQGGQRVSTVFIQADRNGKSVPVEVTSERLVYEDSQRKANFQGSVLLRSSDSILRADEAAIFLRPQSEVAKLSNNTSHEGAPSEVQSIDAKSNIVLRQPGRHATGSHLVYTSDEEKFVLTGTPGSPPSIFDAEHGQVTGVSLTFFNRDDRVLVDSSNSKSISQTRLKK